MPDFLVFDLGLVLFDGGEWDPVMPGMKTYAIFGFRILDDFNETT